MIGTRFRSWLESHLCRPLRSGTGQGQIPQAILNLLPQQRASAFKPCLRSAFEPSGGGRSFVERLQALAVKAGWTSGEVDKIQAYAEFFSGDIAAGYERVVAGRLAEGDFDLLMTACSYLYLADRFEEAYSLLTQFSPGESGCSQREDYLAFLGYLALAAGKDIGTATRIFDSALDHGMHSALLTVNAYPIYFEAGLHDRCDQVRRIIHDEHARDPEAIYAVACVELARDFYPEGFRLAECRYDMPEAARSISADLLRRPRWRGEPIAGRRLLVHAEQGLGDMVMCARYLPLLAADGAEIILHCREVAIPLLAHNFPSVTMIGGDVNAPVSANFDLWVGAMSLPHFYEQSAESIPATAGYLRSPPEQASYWSARVDELISDNRGPRVGLAWSGNPGHRADRRRSIPLDRMAPYLRAFPEMRFFALQPAVPPGHPPNLVNVAEEMVTLADTAALIDAMDLVITVDTSIVHIAGAMGKPTWLLLPRRYEWRWGLSGEQNNWYDSVRVLRQDRHGDWEGLLAQVFRQRLPMFLEGTGDRDGMVG